MRKGFHNSIFWAFLYETFFFFRSVFDDSLDSFINIFEDYIKSMTSFVQLFHGYTEGKSFEIIYAILVWKSNFLKGQINFVILKNSDQSLWPYIVCVSSVHLSFPCSNYLAETGTKYMKRNMGNYMLMYLSCVIVKYVRYSFKFFTYIYIYIWLRNCLYLYTFFSLVSYLSRCHQYIHEK